VKLSTDGDGHALHLWSKSDPDGLH
jgi:hypothetical protein